MSTTFSMEFEELKSIAIYGTVGSLADGEVVYRKLSPPDGTFMVREGGSRHMLIADVFSSESTRSQYCL